MALPVLVLVLGSALPVAASGGQRRELMGKIVVLLVVAVAVGSAGYFVLVSTQTHPCWRRVDAPFEPWTPVRPSVWVLSPNEVWIFGKTYMENTSSEGIWKFDGREFSFVVGLPGWVSASYICSENEMWLGCCDLHSRELFLCRWDGETWTKYIPTLPKKDNICGLIFGIDMLSSDEGWAVITYFRYTKDRYPPVQLGGSDFLHWDGEKWLVVPSPIEGSLRWVDMLSPEEGWAVGDNILYWDGREWSVVPCPSSGILSHIDMLSSDEGWVVGDNILYWDGEKWSVVPSPIEGSLRWVDMLSPEDGWAVGDNGTILHWDGERWSVVPCPMHVDLAYIDMVSSKEGWAVSDSEILKYGEGS